MSEPFVDSFRVRWADLDANGHMRNTAFLDYAAEIRMRFFEHYGFPTENFRRQKLGPVVFEDHVHYQLELSLLDPFTVDLVAAGESTDRRRFRLRSTIRNGQGDVVAVVTTHGGWLDLEARRLVKPPESLAEVIDRMPRSSDWHVLGSMRQD